MRVDIYISKMYLIHLNSLAEYSVRSYFFCYLIRIGQKPTFFLIFFFLTGKYRATL